MDHLHIASRATTTRKPGGLKFVIGILLVALSYAQLMAPMAVQD